MSLTKRHILPSILLSAGIIAYGTAQASYVSEIEANNDLAHAQNLNHYFSVDFDANIENSTTMAHASVYGTGDGSIDYYSFVLQGLSSLILDIDNAMPDLDSTITLYGPSGTIIGINDDRNSIDSGSVHRYDSYLAVSSLAAGQYAVAVGRFYYGTIASGQDYTLHVSASSPTPVPLPAAAPAMLSGLGVLGAFMRRRTTAPLPA